MARSTRKAPRITLYSTRRCSHCRQLKQWLTRHGHRFQEFDIESNPRALKAFQRLGARGVPMLLVGDERVDGFDPERLKQLLG